MVRIGTLANGVWIGNSLGKLKNFRGGHIDWEQQALRNRHMVPSPFSWPNSPGGSTGNLIPIRNQRVAQALL
jgi:hypothetical protein